MAVKLEDIAKITGFSVPTVSRVLTNSSYPVNEETRKKILAAANEMGYRPNIMARSLRTDRTHTVGLVLDDLLSPFTPPIVRGIQDYLVEQGYMSVILNSDLDPELEKNAISTLISRPVDGFIFVEFSHVAPLDEVYRSHKPHVFVHRLFGREIYNSIVPDDYHNASLAVTHLINLGHRRIAYINGPQEWHSSQQRMNAYLDVLATHGIEKDPSIIQVGNWELESGYASAKSILALPNRPSAFFAANDLMALGVIYAIQEMGLKVPDDVAVVGYDNRDFASICRPRITTVSLPVYEMGWAAGEMILQQIASGANSQDEVKVKGKLFIRDSCGADERLKTIEEPRSRVISKRILLNRQPEN